MRQEITAEIAASRETVWEALQRDLGERGGHVQVVELAPPERLQLVVRTATGESLTIGYILTELDAGHSAVTASVEPAGPMYTLKRIFSFGAVEQGYLAAMAMGLENLRVFIEGPPAIDEGSGEHLSD